MYAVEQHDIDAAIDYSVAQACVHAWPNKLTYYYKNSSRDEIANVNFYAVRPEATGIHWNNAK